MIVDDDSIDLEFESGRDIRSSSLLRFLNAGIDLSPYQSHTPPQQENKDCKLLCTISYIKGISCPKSWMSDATSYTASLRINHDEKEFRLVHHPTRPGILIARNLNDESSYWDTSDYFGQNKLVCTIRKQGWLSHRVVASCQLTYHELLKHQFNQKGPDDGSQWYFEKKLSVEVAKSKHKERSANWRTSTQSLQSKFKTLQQNEAEHKTTSDQVKRPVLTMVLHYRLVFLKSCIVPSAIGSPLSDFHILCARAPSSVLADMMKALAAKHLLQGALASTTSDGLNALEVALIHGHAAAVMTLLQRAGRLCFQVLRSRRRCVIHHAVQGGSSNAFDLLRKFLKKYGSTTGNMDAHLHLETLLDWRDEEDHTPLTLACSLSPQGQLVEFLLMAGADIGSVNSVSGYTALMYACAAGSASMVSTLLSVTRGDHEMLANVSGSEVHSEDALSRHIRFNTRSRRLVLGRDGHELSLASYSCNPVCKDLNGRQAIHIAALAGHRDICAMLLKIGVPITSVDNSGCNIFHMLAVAAKGDDASQLLLDMLKAERERWMRYLAEFRPQGLDSMIRAQQPLLSLNQLALCPSEVALLNGHASIASFLLEQAEEIYSAQYLNEEQRKRIAEIRRRMDHVARLGETPEHKEGAEEVKCSEVAQDGAGEGMVGDEAVDELADQLDYRFALTAWTAHLLGLSDSDQP